MEEIVTYDLPDNYFDSYVQKIRAVTQELALVAGRTLVPAQNFAWVVVGDRKRIEAGLKDLGMDLQIVDADGSPAE